jgi:outer membrane beta-barrel protein
MTRKLTRKTTRTKRILSLWALCAAVTGASSVASAQERRSPLADAPAVRKRFELRQLRFEIGAGVGATVGQEFYHALVVGPKLAFHLTDWLAINGTWQYNLTKDFKSSLTDRIDEALQGQPTSTRTPRRQDALAAMNKIEQVWGVHGELIPFAGKLGLFNRLFASYDFYAFGGVGGMKLTAGNESCRDAMGFCPTVGMKLGPSFGLGMRAFFKEALALNIEARDVLLRNNAAGRDVNGDTLANSDDLRWDSNFIVTVNLMLFLPTRARVSD